MRHQVFEATFAVLPKTVIVTNNQYFSVECLNQNIRNEAAGTGAGKLFGERDDKQVIDAERTELFNSLVYS